MMGQYRRVKSLSGGTSCGLFRHSSHMYEAGVCPLTFIHYNMLL